jgi:hypothetical protein
MGFKVSLHLAVLKLAGGGFTLECLFGWFAECVRKLLSYKEIWRLINGNQELSRKSYRRLYLFVNELL